MLVLCPLTLSPSHPPGSIFFPLASRDPGLLLPKRVSFKPQSFWEEEEEVRQAGRPLPLEEEPAPAALQGRCPAEKLTFPEPLCWHCHTCPLEAQAGENPGCSGAPRFPLPGASQSLPAGKWRGGHGQPLFIWRRLPPQAPHPGQTLRQPATEPRGDGQTNQRQTRPKMATDPLLSSTGRSLGYLEIG